MKRVLVLIKGLGRGGAEQLLAQQDHALEYSLWASVRTFRERALLSRQIVGGDRHSRGRPPATGGF